MSGCESPRIEAILVVARVARCARSAPRVPVSGGSSANAQTPAIDKATPWVGAFWTARTQPIIVVSGLDARLIEGT